jgi:hypothetical protein
MDGRFEFLSIEEGIQSLIGPDEIVIGSSTSRLVMKGARLVGYIQVCDTSPFAAALTLGEELVAEPRRTRQ